MACPYKKDTGDTDRSKFKDEKLTYGNYLKIEKLLDCQSPITDVHDEHLFIVIHQAFELWFKQILHELDSVRDIFQEAHAKNTQPGETYLFSDEKEPRIISERLNRIIIILKVIIQQFPILETMTPHAFMDFRDRLFGASGFQSLQFRLLENRLGVLQDNRVNKGNYKHALSSDEVDKVDMCLNDDSILQLVDKWLERTPGLEEKFGLWGKYKEAVEQWIAKEDENPKMKQSCETMRNAFASIADKASYDEGATKRVYKRDGGESVDVKVRRLSFKAFQGAVFIFVYRHLPRYQQPFQILTQLLDVDELLMKWRCHHVMMVQRMIGNKSGTGGTGYSYLRDTLGDEYKVFLDLFNISTYLVPRSHLPATLNDVVEKILSDK